KKRSRSVTLICSKRMVNRLNVPPIVPIALNFRFILDNCFLYFSSSYNMISINVNVLYFMRKDFIWYLYMSTHFFFAVFLSFFYFCFTLYIMFTIIFIVLNFMREDLIWYLSMSTHFMWAGFLPLGFIISSFSVKARSGTGFIMFFMKIGIGIVKKIAINPPSKTMR